LERLFTRSDLQKDIAEEQADSLRPLIVVDGHGAFVAAFRDLPQIILAHLYPQFAEPAGLALAQRPHSLSRCCHGGLPLLGDDENRSHGVNGPRGAGRWAAIGGGVAKRAMHAAATFGQICI
jgi:hypothetical protein